MGGCKERRRHRGRISGDVGRGRLLRYIRKQTLIQQGSELTVQPLVHVHGTVKEVLPCIQEENC